MSIGHRTPLAPDEERRTLRAYEPYPEGANYGEIRERMLSNMIFFLDGNLTGIVTEITGPDGQRCLQMELELVVKR